MVFLQSLVHAGQGRAGRAKGSVIPQAQRAVAIDAHLLQLFFGLPQVCSADGQLVFGLLVAAPARIELEGFLLTEAATDDLIRVSVAGQAS